MTAAKIVFGAAFVFLVSLAAGQLFFQAVGLRLRRGERVFLPFIAGAAILSNIVFALAVCGVFYSWIEAGLGAAVIAIWLFRRREASAQPEPDPQPGVSRGWNVLFWSIYAVFGIAYVIAAMAPEISPDGGGGYHLGFVARYYEHRGFTPIRTNMLSGLAEGIEMLFLSAFAFGKHSAAALTHLLFLLTLPFGMIACGRRAGKPEAGLVGGLLVFLAPVAAKDATSAYVDVATAAFIFGAFCMFEIWRERQRRGALIALGLMAGFCYACKLTAGITPLCAMVAVAATGLARRSGTRIVFRQCALIAVMALALASPWLVRNAVVFGDPFYPFLNRLFPNPWQYPMIETEWRAVVTDRHGVSIWRIPWELAAGGSFIGIVGPVFLLSPIALLSLRSRFGRFLLIAFAAFGLTWFSNAGGRFILPALPFLALAFALGVLDLGRVGKPLAVTLLFAHAVLSWPDWIPRWSPWFQWKIDTLDPAVALRIVPEEKFIAAHWGELAAGKMLDRFVPAGDLVYSPDMGMLAYHHRTLLGNFESALCRRTMLVFETPSTPGLANTWRRELRFAPTMVSRIRLVSGTSTDVDLRISEIRFYKGSTEVPRNAQWRVTASANPWESPLAFDNGPLSWWTTGRYVEKGMWIRTDFDKPTEVDRVEIDQNSDQRGIVLYPEAPDGTDTWRALPVREEGIELTPPADVRMEARDQLKRMGIRWVMLREQTLAAKELRRNTPLWGMTEIAQCPGFRLWRLD